MRTELYIDGKWVKGSSTTPVYDPADGSVIAEVHHLQDELLQLLNHLRGHKQQL